jgi:hypothetical protein
MEGLRSNGPSGWTQHFFLGLKQFDTEVTKATIFYFYFFDRRRPHFSSAASILEYVVSFTRKERMGGTFRLMWPVKVLSY